MNTRSNDVWHVFMRKITFTAAAAARKEWGGVFWYSRFNIDQMVSFLICRREKNYGKKPVFECGDAKWNIIQWPPSTIAYSACSLRHYNSRINIHNTDIIKKSVWKKFFFFLQREISFFICGCWMNNDLKREN